MPHHTISAPRPNSPSDASDLRRRKRIRTKQMVQREALRLFADKGYDQTTVDDIAHAAAMSPRTFFRYFPSKEDVVLWDEYDERPLQELLQIRPGGDPLAQLVVRVREIFAEIYQNDRELLLARTRLSFKVPEIRARFLQAQLELFGSDFQEIADVVGARHDDLQLAVTLAALYAAMLVAVERWQRDDGREDLLHLFDEAVARLAAATTDLQDTVQAARAGTRPGEPDAVAVRPEP